jgi:hypothetical protein
LLALLVVAAIGYARFEFAVVKPVLSTVHATMQFASAGERAPPAPLREMLDSAYGDSLKYHVAREILASDPSQLEGVGLTQRQIAELAVGLTLRLRLSRTELEATYLSRAYMGPGVRGFEKAAAKYLNKDIAHLTRLEAAKLVAIAHAPTYFLGSPARLEAKSQLLLNHAE